MPFLRFSRDRRGYESTYLLQSSRRRGEQGRAALLYWFRTPPHVKLGRAAFDEETIRELEEQHPDVEFDWPHILAARPPAAEPAEPERPSRRPPRRPEAAPPRHGGAPRRAPAPMPPPDVSAGEAESEREAPTLGRSQEEPSAAEPLLPERVSTPLPETPEAAPRRFVRVFDAPAPHAESTEPSVDAASGGEDEGAPHHLSEPSAVERILGSDRLNRLRGQHAAYLARIATRVTDPVLAERLRAVADRADPDAWVTAADVEAGLAGLEAVYAEIARHVGRRRRRRRRRGESSGPMASGGPAADFAEGPEDGDDSPGGGESPDDQG